MKIIIDPGHGGTEIGASAFGLYEKDLNIIFSRKLAAKLIALGYEVDQSILNDVYYDSVALTNLIKASGADLCISCHNNAFNGTARGSEVIHSIHSDGLLASYILEEISKTGFPVRKAYGRESTTYAGVDYYFIIRQTYPEVETIIVEFGFMDNADDFNILTDNGWQDNLVTAVANGVLRRYPVAKTTKTPIQGTSILLTEQLKKALSGINPSANLGIVDTYYRVAPIYGIKADLAFLQAMLETNWLRFTGVVRPEQNNFAGLGATSSSNPGEWFPTIEAGVEAHIQHLYAYSSAAPLPTGRTLYDTRFHYVTRGIAPNWEDLNGKWAVPGAGYGENIINMQSNVTKLYPVENSGGEPSAEQPDPTPGHWAKPCNDELLQAGFLFDDHSGTLDNPASEGMVLCLINRLRKALQGQSPLQGEITPPPGVHWAKQCNDELLQAGILYDDHTETLDNPASEGMVICLVNRLRKEFLQND